MPEDLARYFAAYPTVRITLKERLSADIVAAVADGQADIGVVAMDTPHPALVYLPYRVDQLVLLAPPGSTLAALSEIAFVECLDQPFISLQSGAALHTFLMNHAAALGARLDVRVQVSGYRAIARLVSSGAGIGVVPRTALDVADRNAVAIIELTDTWARRELCVCLRRSSSDANPFLNDLVKVLTGDASLSRTPE